MSRKKKFKRILLCALLISLPLLSMTNIIKSENLYNDKMVEMCIESGDSIIRYDSIEMYQMTQKIKKDSIKNELINETERYIFSISSKVNNDIPRFLVENSLEYNIDLMFMIAQTQIETTFGTAGAGRESSRRSLFGVALRRYTNYENAIIDYCEVLKKYYLVRGKTEQHLMQRYVTSSGARYAGNPNYERELRNTYNIISRNTKLDDLQKEYKLIDI